MAACFFTLSLVYEKRIVAYDAIGNPLKRKYIHTVLGQMLRRVC